MTRPKVSIIVPIYNAGDKLEKCLDSLVHQTLNEIEIILVLDCPTDGSDIIAEFYAKSDQRIIIIKNVENLHIGLSRNEGLKIATGEYIGFSDHDDYRELDMYEKLYKKASLENLDLLLGITVKVSNGSETIYNFPEYLNDTNIRNYILVDLIGWGNFQRSSPLGTNVHPNLYRNEFLHNNHMCFVDTKIITPEDKIFQIECLWFANKVGLITDIFYYHQMFDSSEGHSHSYNSYSKHSLALLHIYNFLHEEHCYDVYEPNFVIAVNKVFLNSILVNITKKFNLFELIKMLNFFKKMPYCKKSFVHYSLDTTHRSFFKNTIRRVIANYLRH